MLVPWRVDGCSLSMGSKGIFWWKDEAEGNDKILSPESMMPNETPVSG